MNVRHIVELNEAERQKLVSMMRISAIVITQIEAS